MPHRRSSFPSRIAACVSLLLGTIPTGCTESTITESQGSMVDGLSLQHVDCGGEDGCRAGFSVVRIGETRPKIVHVYLISEPELRVAGRTRYSHSCESDGRVAKSVHEAEVGDEAMHWQIDARRTPRGDDVECAVRVAGNEVAPADGNLFLVDFRTGLRTKRVHVELPPTPPERDWDQDHRAAVDYARTLRKVLRAAAPVREFFDGR